MSSAVIVADGDFTVLESGSHVRMREMLDYLLSSGFPVIVYSYRNHPTLPWTDEGEQRFSQLFANASLVLERRPFIIKYLVSAKRLALRLWPRASTSILEFDVPFLTPHFRALSSIGGPMIVHFADALPALNGLRMHDVIVDSHDLGFLKRARTGTKRIYDVVVLLKLRAELSSLRTCRATIAISAFEAAVFRAFLPKSAVIEVPHFKSPRAEALPVVRETTSEFDMLFIGSDYGFNAPGLLEFIAQNGSWVKKHRVAVAGSVCNVPEVRLAAAEHPYLTLLGFVDDLDQLLRRTKLTISPVNGTGLKTKILDSVFRGVPVLASEQSIEGLPSGFSGAVFPIREEIAEALLHDDSRLLLARGAAAAYAEAISEPPGLRTLCELLRSW